MDGGSSSSVQGGTTATSPVDSSITDTKLKNITKQVQSYKLLAAKLPPLPPPPSPQDSHNQLSPKEYRYSAAYLVASDMPTYNLIDIANYTLSPVSAELGRRVVDARANLAPGALVWSMEPKDLVRARFQSVREQELVRIEELTEQLATLEITDTDRLKITLELKRLQLADKQRQLREQVLVHIQHSSTLDTAYDTTTYRRNKKQTLREPRIIERAIKEHRVQAKSMQSRKTTDEFLRRLSNQVARLSNESKGAQQRQIRISKTVMQYHISAEKEEQKRQERLAKDRIKALRADDEETYLRLIDQEKDTRLTHLLKQTDEFLDSLTARVYAQQADSQVQQSDKSDQERIDQESVMDRKDYYGTAHRVREEVNLQPSLLVGGKLKDYQIKGLQWLVSLYNNHLNGILADEMGLGKTIQAISLISYLMERKGQTGPFLIIVPLSTITNWVNEFEKWAPNIIKVEYKGSQLQRKSAQITIKQGKFNVLITTYEYIIKDRPFLAKFNWLYMIIDEGHRMKNTESKLVSTLTGYYKARFRLILTGTPLQNNLPELWALLNFILPRIFNSSKTFEEWFNAPFANTGERVELNEEESLLVIRRLHKVLRPFLLRRMKKDVEGELPDKIERVIKCPMSALQLRLYQIVKQKNSISNDGPVAMRRLNNTIMQLRKICNHPFVFPEVEDQLNPSKMSNDLLWRTSGKFELLSRLLPKLKATGHRVLIFFQMTQVMTIMEDFLVGLRLPYLRLDGSTKSEDRSELLKLFNQPNSDYFCFLLSTRAGGLGLNLQTADTVIIFDSDWNPHQDLQAQDRAHRIGQTKEVRIFRLITNDSVEEYILERAQFKLNLDGKVIQAGKFDHKSTNEERELMLRALMESEQGSKDEEEVYDDEELNEILGRNDEELQVFRAMDGERSREWAGRSRLIEEKELPRVYLAQEEDPDLESQKSDSIIPSARRRNEVNYDESLSDKQFLKEIENPKKLKTTPLKLVFTSITSELTKKLQFIYNTVECAVDDGNRYRSEIFMELPSADLYPDYYRLVKAPISMSQIRDKLLQYSSLKEFKEDFDQMYGNAMFYNQEGSLVWEDAGHLKALVHEMCADACTFDGDDMEMDQDEDTEQEGDDDMSIHSDHLSEILSIDE